MDRSFTTDNLVGVLLEILIEQEGTILFSSPEWGVDIFPLLGRVHNQTSVWVEGDQPVSQVISIIDRWLS